MGRHSRLKTFLFWRYTLFAVVPLLLLGLLALAHLSGRVTREIEAQNLALARSLSGHVREALSGPLTLLRQVPLLVTAADGDRTRLEDLLSRTVEQSTLLESIAILDGQGRIDLLGSGSQLAGRRQDLAGLDLSGELFYRRALATGQLVWSQTFLSPLSGRISLALCLPTKNGMLVATFNLAPLTRVIDGNNDGLPLQVAVVDSRGTLIFHTDPELSHQHLNLRHLAPIAAGLAGRSGSWRYRWNGRDLLGSVAPVRDTGWMIMVSQEASSAYAPLSDLRNLLLGALAVAILGSILLALAHASRLSEPLIALSQAASRITTGSLATSLPPQSFHEAEVLAQSLQHMLTGIQEREERLHASQKHYARLFNLGSDAIFLNRLNPEGQPEACEEVNSAALQLLGYSRSELLALPPKELMMLHDEDPELARFLEGQLLRTGHVTFETSLRNAAGRTLPVECSSQLFYEEGRPKVLTVARDIGYRQAAQQTLHALVASFVETTGQASLERITRELCRWLGADGAAVVVRLNAAEMLPLALYSDDAQQQLLPQLLAGTPCQMTLEQGQLYYPERVREAFPEVPFLQENQIEGYLSIALYDSTGEPIGVLLGFSRRLMPLPDNAWEVLRLMATKAATEIERSHDRKALEEALVNAEEARERVDTLLRSIHDGLVACDAQRRIVLLNPAAERLLGVTMGSVLQRPVAEVIHHPALRDHLLAQPTVNGAGCDLDLQLPGTGTVRTIQVHTARVQQRQQLMGTITSLRDVTRERESDRLKSEFISIAAHELQTPLTAVIGFAELLLRQDEFGPFTDEQQGEFLGEIYEKCEFLSHTVDDLLDISRMEKGRALTLDRRPCDLHALIRQVVEQHRRGRYRHSFDLALADTPLEVAIDRHRITQVLDNLLANAVKYSPDGGRIRVGTETREDRVEVWVTDQGIGIPAEQLQSIFEKFYRVDTRNTAISGLGLGLSVARGIIDAHGGRIWADSAIGQGTTLHFTLPLVPPATD